jgi:hypothetical protein
MNARLLLALSTAALLAVGSAPAFAQDSAQPAAGAAGYDLKSGIATKKMRYFAPSQEVVLRGRVTPAVPG